MEHPCPLETHSPQSGKVGVSLAVRLNTIFHTILTSIVAVNLSSVSLLPLHLQHLNQVRQLLLAQVCALSTC